MRKQILVDISQRKISFPDVSNLQIPIRSTYTGELITNNDPRPLIETVLDMLLTQPVNWDLVVDKVVETSPKDLHIQLLNVGPGTGLTKPVERALGSHVTLLDLTTHNEIGGLAEKVPKQEPIAIVGMAVNMPGAPNISQLWETLERGINTIAKVRLLNGHKIIANYPNYPPSRISRFQNIDSACLTITVQTTFPANVS